MLVHSDLLRAGRPSEATGGRKGLLQAHWKTISHIAGERDVWMPAFNYCFADSRTHDPINDGSHIGPFTEYFRNEIAQWRTPTPMFSFSGTGGPPPNDPGPEIDPFGSKSAHQHFLDRDGVDLAYGTSLNSANVMHYAERMSGGPLYRYDKRFPGNVRLDDGSCQEVVLLYHVRPWGMGLDYDHPRILSDLVDAGVCWSWKPGPLQFVVASSRNLVNFWTERLADDPLYLLDSQSRNWVAPMLEKLGRRFELEDFEALNGPTAGP